jgi:uncharacterized protein involved in response to NO
MIFKKLDHHFNLSLLMIEKPYNAVKFKISSFGFVAAFSIFRFYFIPLLVKTNRNCAAIRF